jgi:hypothetical protein
MCKLGKAGCKAKKYYQIIKQQMYGPHFGDRNQMQYFRLFGGPVLQVLVIQILLHIRLRTVKIAK